MKKESIGGGESKVPAGIMLGEGVKGQDKKRKSRWKKKGKCRAPLVGSARALKGGENQKH